MTRYSLQSIAHMVRFSRLFSLPLTAIIAI
jgi:hypothetical protein